MTDIQAMRLALEALASASRRLCEGCRYQGDFAEHHITTGGGFMNCTAFPQREAAEALKAQIEAAEEKA